MPGCKGQTMHIPHHDRSSVRLQVPLRQCDAAVPLHATDGVIVVAKAGTLPPVGWMHAPASTSAPNRETRPAALSIENREPILLNRSSGGRDPTTSEGNTERNICREA